jgi:hypothetical protein
VTVPEQGRPATPAGVAAVAVRRGHVLDVLAALRDRGPAQHDPDRIRTDAGHGLVELEFDAGPEPVLAWAGALRFPNPVNHADPHLMQTIVLAEGQVLGWRVEIRHVHTVPSTVAGVARVIGPR